MGLISGLLAIMFAAASRLIADDVKAWLPDVTRILIDRAILRLPESARKDAAEEWQADLDRFPGHISKIIRAMLFLQGAGRIARELSPVLLPDNPSAELVTETTLSTLRNLSSELQETARRKDILAKAFHIFLECLNTAVERGLPLDPDLIISVRKAEDVLLRATSSSSMLAWDLARVTQDNRLNADAREILNVVRNASLVTRRTRCEIQDIVVVCIQLTKGIELAKLKISKL